MIGVAGPTPLWYAARSTGYVSLLLLTGIVALGITTALRVSGREWPRFVSQALHRNLSLLVLVFLAIHIVTSVADPFAGISILNSVAPFTGPYRPIWLGVGVVSAELLVALTLTSLLRHRIGFRLWRVVHFAAYLCWPAAVLHGLGTGSDTRSVWSVLVTLACISVVIGALFWRLVTDRANVPPWLRVGGITTTLAAGIAVLGFAVAGPLHSGWARAAGTPPNLLAASAGSDSSTSPAPVTVTPPPASLPIGVADNLSGTVATGSNGQLDVELTDRRDPTLRLSVILSADQSSGQVTVTQSGATLCNAAATVSRAIEATCGGVRLSLQLTQRADASLTGQMTTQRAP